MSNQGELCEEEFHENVLLDSVLLNRFSVLQLPHRLPPFSEEEATGIKNLEKCISCGKGSAKRRSSPPPSYEPSSKRAAISTPNPSPPSSTERKRDVLRRCFSDFPSSPAASSYPLSTSPMQPGESQDSPGSASFPLIRRPLYKSSSCPVSSDYEPVVAFTTPTKRPPLLPPQISNQESSKSKKLKKLKEIFEEMRQWMGKVACEDEEDESDHPNDDIINYTSKEKAENQSQDSVWVKETEGGLVLHFQCPCGEGYEIFLHGDKCYYRLT